MTTDTAKRSCTQCGQAHDSAYDAMACDLAVALADNKRMRDALCALDGVLVVGSHDNPGIGHEAMWRIVREGLGREEP